MLELDHYMKDFEAIYVDAEKERTSLVEGKFGPTAKYTPKTGLTHPY